MATEQQALTERKAASAAYLPFATFTSALDELKQIGIPNKIERSTFPSKSGQDQTQIVSALKFFDLIADDGTPQPLLSDLVNKENEQRKPLIKQLIETHYSDIVALDFAKLTPSQLDQALSDQKYNIQGETKKKAKTFLLKAAKFAGYTIHQNLTKITRNRKGARKGAAGEDEQSNNGGGSVRQPTPPAPAQESKSPYQVLIEILSPDMEEAEQDAVWTLIRYLKKKEANQ